MIIIPLKTLVKALIEFFEFYKSILFSEGKKGIKITETEYARITCLILIMITTKPIEYKREHLPYLLTDLVNSLKYSSFDSTRSKFVLRKKKKYKIIEMTKALFYLNRLIFLISQLIEFIGPSNLEESNKKWFDIGDNIIYRNLVAEIFAIINNSSFNIITIMTFVIFNHLAYTSEKKKAFLSNITTKKRKILLSKVTKKQLSSMVSKSLNRK